MRDQAVEGRRARRASAGRSPSSSPTGWLVLDFLTWSRDVKKNTAKWVHSQKLYLDGWKKKLGRVDLRRLSYTDQVKPAMDGQGAYRQRAATILALLPVAPPHRRHLPRGGSRPRRFYLPEPRAEQATPRKAVPRDVYLKALEHLIGMPRDLLLLQGGTGMHVSEAYRFAVEGTVELVGDDQVRLLELVPLVLGPLRPERHRGRGTPMVRVPGRHDLVISKASRGLGATHVVAPRTCPRPIRRLTLGVRVERLRGARGDASPARCAARVSAPRRGDGSSDDFGTSRRRSGAAGVPRRV